MTPTTLAETILRDVPRIQAFGGNVLSEDYVLAALTAAMDPALTERAGEVLSRLRKADEYEPLGHDGWEAADLLTALLAQNAALRAERDRYLRHLTTGAESLNAYKARAEAAEAQIAALTAQVEGLTGAGKDAADDWEECVGHVVAALGHKPDWYDHEMSSVAGFRAALSATTEERK